MRHVTLKNRSICTVTMMLFSFICLFESQSYADIVVTQVKDVIAGNDGCSLREAIIAANFRTSYSDCSGINNATEQIILDKTGTGTNDSNVYKITGEPIEIKVPVRISNNKSGKSYIKGYGANFAAFLISSSFTSDEAIFDDLDISGFKGGAILANPATEAKIYITRCHISGNGSVDNYFGGVYGGPNANIQMADCFIEKNTGNWGGGVLVDDGNLAITRTTVSGNTAVYDGGGVNVTYGSMAMANCTISGNSAKGLGGGVYLYALKQTNSEEGEIPDLLMGVNQIRYSTIAFNKITASGGAGGGIYIEAGGLHTALVNTILDANTVVSGSSSPDCRSLSGSLVSHGVNLVKSTSGCSGLSSVDKKGVSASLSSLATNSATNGTRTHMPNSSNAINQISKDNQYSKVSVDNRNLSRLSSGSPKGGKYDIGAVEK
jgi:CSLREA domain-containing protein